MTARPRLLFLCQTVPYPPDSGVAIRSFHVLRLLARAFDVTAVCFARRKGEAVPHRDLAVRVAALRRAAQGGAVPGAPEANRRPPAGGHPRSVRGEPLH